MNYKKIISENLDFISNELTHHDCERLIKKIFSNKFKHETGFYGDFVATKEYEQQKKEKIQKIKKIGIKQKDIEYYNCLDYMLRQIVTHEIDDKYLTILNADYFFNYYTYANSGNKGYDILMKYFKDVGIDIDELKMTNKTIKIKKSSKSYTKLKNLLYLHNDLMKKINDYYNI